MITPLMGWRFTLCPPLQPYDIYYKLNVQYCQMEVNFSADTGCSYGPACHKKNTHESNYNLHLLPLLHIFHWSKLWEKQADFFHGLSSPLNRLVGLFWDVILNMGWCTGLCWDGVITKQFQRSGSWVDHWCTPLTTTFWQYALLNSCQRLPCTFASFTTLTM